MKKHHLHLIIFGVSGSGKTSIGKMLAEELNAEFIEGDDFHPETNIEKMRNGHPLTDADRLPWLHILETEIHRKIKENKEFVLSCSALKLEYREILRKAGNVIFLFLDVPESVVANRLLTRKGHFMPMSLLHSQIETLERPQQKENDVMVIDASQPPQKVLLDILFSLSKIS
nr:gluconokinase [uncultured Pedobacter sp.]